MISGQSGIEPQLRKISSPTNQSGEHSFVIAIQIPRRMTTQYFSFSFDIYIISKIFKNIKLKGQPIILRAGCCTGFPLCFPSCPILQTLR